MNKTEFIQIIREVVKKEIRSAIREELLTYLPAILEDNSNVEMFSIPRISLRIQSDSCWSSER